nr:hypothetical protein [Tanacetum cinerariifolium]
GEGSGTQTEPHHTPFPEIKTGQPLLSPPPCPVIQHQGLLPLLLKRAEVEINRLKERVKILEDKEGVIGDKSEDDAPIKGRTTVLARETNVPTGSDFIPTAGPPTTVISTCSEVGPTASPIILRRKGKEVMVESDTPKKKKLQEQIDAQ